MDPKINTGWSNSNVGVGVFIGWNGLEHPYLKNVPNTFPVPIPKVLKFKKNSLFQIFLIS